MNEPTLTSKAVLCFPTFPELASDLSNKEVFDSAKYKVKQILEIEQLNQVSLSYFKPLCFNLSAPTATETSMVVLSALMDQAANGPAIEPIFQKNTLDDLLKGQENDTCCIYIAEASDILSLIKEVDNKIVSIVPGQAIFFELKGEYMTVALLGEVEEVLETETT